jgi:transcriptional regulator with XRE-family HTH domain
MNRLQRVIQERADEHGLTMNAVATRAGLNRQTLYNLMGAQTMKAMPRRDTLAKIARALQLPEQLLVEAAAESVGIRLYDDPVDDPDTKVVVAAMGRLSQAERRRLRKMVETMFEESLGGGT